MELTMQQKFLSRRRLFESDRFRVQALACFVGRAA
jgi:hypothetical protein